MNKVQKALGFITLLFLSLRGIAQEGGMAAQLRADGKIWVVVGVITIILLGLFVLLIWLEKRIKRLETKPKE